MYSAVAKVFFKLAICLVIAGAIATGTICSIYWHLKPGLPNSDFLNDYRAPEVTHVYDRHFRPIHEFAPVHRINLKIEDIPKKVIAAFLVAEDKNFYYHPGIDPMRIARAVLQNFSQKKSQQTLVGASTITQQVAKNFLVGNEKSFLRKFREAFATLSIERQLSKDRILELYLNQIYLGNGAYGLQAAALNYFNKSMENLTISEACLLAALPKAPAQLSKNTQKLKARRDAIIQALSEQNYISKQEASSALEQSIEFHQEESSPSDYGYYITPLREVLVEEMPKLNITSGLEIFSCMDARFQQAAQKALRDGLLKYNLTQKIFYKPIVKLGDKYSIEDLNQIAVPDCPENYQKSIVDFSSEKPFIQLQNKQSLPLDTTSWSLETPLTKGDVVLVEVKNGKAHLRQIPEVSGAVVVMEARTGQVLALVGGWSHTMSPFNCATQATRQPGSSFKPFVYLAALEQGMSPNDIINDKSITMLLNNGREIYKPKNIDKKTHGFVTVKNSLAYSHNLSSIQLGLDTGIEHIQDIAELFEVYNNASKHPSMILGSKETTLLKLTNAYAMIFNGGYHLKPKFYNAYAQRKISSLNKNSNFCCFERQQSLMTVPISTITSYQRLASPSAIFGLLEMLRAVITHGTGKSLLPIEREFGVKIRGKTGTTNSNRDAWFIGSVSIPGTIYQDDNPLVIGVFVGFLNPKNLGDGKGGALVALPIFGNFIKNIVSDTL
jgi:penicillin-binding protein 1A